MGKGAATLNDSVVIIGAKSNKKGEPLQMQRKSIHSLVNQVFDDGVVFELAHSDNFGCGGDNDPKDRV